MRGSRPKRDFSARRLSGAGGQAQAQRLRHVDDHRPAGAAAAVAHHFDAACRFDLVGVRRRLGRVGLRRRRGGGGGRGARRRRGCSIRATAKGSPPRRQSTVRSSATAPTASASRPTATTIRACRRAARAAAGLAQGFVDGIAHASARFASLAPAGPQNGRRITSPRRRIVGAGAAPVEGKFCGRPRQASPRAQASARRGKNVHLGAAPGYTGGHANRRGRTGPPGDRSSRNEGLEIDGRTEGVARHRRNCARPEQRRLRRRFDQGAARPRRGAQAPRHVHRRHRRRLGPAPHGLRGRRQRDRRGAGRLRQAGRR